MCYSGGVCINKNEKWFVLKFLFSLFKFIFYWDTGSVWKKLKSSLAKRFLPRCRERMLSAKNVLSCMCVHLTFKYVHCTQCTLYSTVMLCCGSNSVRIHIFLPDVVQIKYIQIHTSEQNMLNVGFFSSKSKCHDVGSVSTQF